MDKSLRPAEIARRARFGVSTGVIKTQETPQGEHLSNLFSSALGEASEEAMVRRRLQRLSRQRA